MIHPLLAALFLVVALLVSLRVEAASYPYQSCFEIASSLHDVPLDVLLAVAATESAWNADARSPANAHGIMQIQWPGTARHLGVSRVSELYNPCLNIELGARYLRELLDRNGGDLDRALAAYNYGPSRVEGVVELPAGASRYVDAVSGHRVRIREAASETLSRADEAEQSHVRFDHPARARAYAATLNARVRSAEFASRPGDDGYVVTMRIRPEGLSLQDAGLLQALGWPGLGEPR